ncbi:beta-ketoacyl-ACP synthase III [Azotosporobacter soli]|uniref:beta-ketoacyl-ACP synthase III n=1 Tax=Azotosporobacter soli TaxID=3055040 RepID=UPI0031FE4CAD
MNKRAVGILGTGSYMPERIVTNKDLEKTMETSDEWIVSRTGIGARRVAAPEEATSDLAAEAGRRALLDANVNAEELDLIIVATVSPDMAFPSTACLVQAQLGAKRAAAFDISVACSGFIYGMSIAQQFIQTGLYQKVLVVGAETLSRFISWDDRKTGMLFGDGAGAAVLGETAEGFGILGLDMGADGSGAELLKIPAGGSREPASLASVKERGHIIHMDGSEVFKFAVKVMGESALRALEAAGLTTADLALLVPHQANIRIIQSAVKRLGMTMDKIMVNVDRYGNTSAASIPIALDEAAKQGRFKTGDTIGLCGFGAGLTWGSAIIKWSR